MQFKPVSYFEKNIKSTRPIWGINTAAESELGAMSEVLLAIPSLHGGDPDRLLIQQTWLPQELTKVVGRRRLLQSSDFRRAVDRGLVSLITSEDAERLLRQDGAREEQQRLRAIDKHVKDAGSAKTISGKTSIYRADGVENEEEEDTSGRNKTVIIDPYENSSMADLAADGIEEHEPGVSIQFKMWVDKVCTTNDKMARNEVKSRRAFKTAELKFLQRSLPRSHQMTLAMVNTSLSKSVGK